MLCKTFTATINCLFLSLLSMIDDDIDVWCKRKVCSSCNKNWENYACWMLNMLKFFNDVQTKEWKCVVTPNVVYVMICRRWIDIGFFMDVNLQQRCVVFEISPRWKNVSDGMEGVVNNVLVYQMKTTTIQIIFNSEAHKLLALIILSQKIIAQWLILLILIKWPLNYSPTKSIP